MFRTVTAILLLGLGATIAKAEPCKLSSERLIALAREAVGKKCEAPRACRIVVVEKDRPKRCAVDVTPVPINEFGLEGAPIPGNFEVIEFSNAGKVVHRQGGA